MKRLDMDLCIDGDLKELQLDELDYQKLWESGVFDELNNHLGIIIDDYEDEMIPLEKLQEAIKVVERFSHENYNIISSFIVLLKIALERKTGMFFYF